MKFLKEHLYDIVKLYITQIGITIFSLIMYTASGAISSDAKVSSAVQISISVFSILFYFTLIYTASWDWGAKDKIRIDGGRMKPDVIKGVKMSLLANVPNFILVFLAITSYAFCVGGIEGAFVSIGTVSTLIMRFTAAMHQGLIKNVIDAIIIPSGTYLYYLIQSVSYCIMFLASVGVTHLGYWLGTKELRIFGFLKSKGKN